MTNPPPFNRTSLQRFRVQLRTSRSLRERAELLKTLDEQLQVSAVGQDSLETPVTGTPEGDKDEPAPSATNTGVK